MAAPADAPHLLDEYVRGVVSKRGYEVYCGHTRQADEALRGVVSAFAVHLLRRVAGLVRRSTAPLSQSELQRTINKMDKDERKHFAELILELDASDADGE